jgi:hypothetical protein
VRLGFALDCHDRDYLAVIAARRALAARDVQELMHRAVAGASAPAADPTRRSGGSVTTA